MKLNQQIVDADSRRRKNSPVFFIYATGNLRYESRIDTNYNIDELRDDDCLGPVAGTHNRANGGVFCF